MKHRILISTLLMSAIGATAAVALDEMRASKLSQAPTQKSTVAEGANNFYKSDEVTMQRVTFKNQYNMQVAGNLFIPKTLNQNTKNPAIIRDSSPCLSICPSGARVRGRLAMLWRRIFMLKLSVLRSIF